MSLYLVGATLLGMPKGKEPKESLSDEPGTWIFRDIPREVMRRAKAAAAIQGKSVRQLTIDLMEEHLQELDRRGILPKGK
ncbi:MAG: hypothetical protein KC643_27070 [Nitrospira sp.]|nr:hypothetical protein [Nitrospira sp.]